AHARRLHVAQVTPDILLEAPVQRTPFGSLFGELLPPIGTEVRRQHSLTVWRIVRIGCTALQLLVVRRAQTFEYDERRHYRDTTSGQTGEERSAIDARSLIERRIEAVFGRCLTGREHVMRRTTLA